jgi:beta-galactosidase
LGTPTATPPAWLGEKYPEIYKIDEDGIRKTHGARRNCSYTNEIYKEYSYRICEEMAKEFGEKPGVIGWQTDNEFHLSPDYSEESKERWHSWLQKRYKTIDNINKDWNLVLWSQTYNSFSQIPMVTSHVWHHPSLQLAWTRFWSDMVVEFQDLHIKAIRKYSELPITHDGMPSQTLDYEKLFKDLDYMAVNNYHSFEAYDRIQSNYDRMRGYNKGFHWLFETAPNNSGGGAKGQTWFLHQPDNSMHAALWMNYASGGQGAMFWLWRQHWSGQEMVHGSILSAWGKPAANFEDLVLLGENLNKTSDFQMNNPVAPAEVALFWNHENLAMLRVEEFANDIKYYTDFTYRFYRPIADSYIHRDVIHFSNDISDYKVLFAPILPMLSSEIKEKLQKWVEDGGIFIMGPMTGYRNDEWTAFKNHAYGDFGVWTGIEVDSRIPVGTKRRPAEIPLMLKSENIIDFENSECGLISEALSSKTGKILARYQSGMHDGKAAIIENKVGKGKVVVLGTDPGKENFAKIAQHYTKEADVKTVADGDKGVVIVPRKGSNSEGIIIINIANSEKTITSEIKGYTDLLTGKKLSANTITLKPFEVLVLEK